MEPPKISIIVPVYKVEQYLRQCLDSVLDQTFSDYECILVDDGSPDACPAICDEYAENDRRFKVIHKENGGLSDARNTGIQAAIGEYVVLLDSDDMFADINALENLYKIIKNTEAEVIFNGNLTTFITDDYESYNGFNADFICGNPIQFYKEIMRNRKILLAGCCFSIQRSFLLKYDLFFKVGILHEDEHWMPRVICSAGKIGINHALFYAYRKNRGNSITMTIIPKNAYDLISTIDDLLNTVNTKGNISAYCAIIYKDFCICLLKYVFHLISYISKEYQKEIIKILNKIQKLSFIFLYQESIRNILFYFIVNMIKTSYKRYNFFYRIIKIYEYFKNTFLNQYMMLRIIYL